MLNDTFIFKDKRARALGIELSGLIELSAAVPRVITASLPGRSGDLHYYDGSYENRVITAPCYLLSFSAEHGIDAINSWLLNNPGYHRFEDPADRGHYMMARAVHGLEKKMRLGLMNPFKLEFDAMPQRFLKFGERFIDVTASGVIRNPTAFPSLPLLEIVSNGGDVTISTSKSTLYLYDFSGALMYDAESDRAYYGNLEFNEFVATSNKFELSPGTNSIYIRGDVLSVKIKPRWWEI